MAQYKKKQKPAVSQETADDAMAVAKATQRPGQTKEQTKLIAQGVQKGIEEYKKRHKSKARELDKKLKKASAQPLQEAEPVEVDSAQPSRSSVFPWVLLVLSWIGFGVYLGLNK